MYGFITHKLQAASQAFPPKPRFTEVDVPDLTGKVCLVTGANTGIGKLVAQILYSKNATVWLAARSKEKGENAIQDITARVASSKGALRFLQLDLADLTTIAASADQFLAAEARLDILFNNAGVMAPPMGSKTKQGYELQLGTNCVGTFLFTQKLTAVLQATAKTAPKDSVRVVWVSSSAVDAFSPKGGIELDNLDYKRDKPIFFKYGVSKAGNYFHATEFAKRFRKDGIVSIALNPGNLKTELDRTAVWYFYMVRVLTTYPPINGAYTELFAAFSPEITLEKTGTWVVPWGRFLPPRADVEAATVPESEGGPGTDTKFWQWCEEQVKPYA